MVHEAAVVLNITSEIGHMMADPTYCQSSATQDDIMKFFATLIAEQESSYTLKNSDLKVMISDISHYFDGVTSDKNSLIAEEAAESAADLVASAATIAAAAGSWVPFVNFGLAAAAIAATAVALGLEIASEKLQGTVVEEISNADTNIIKYDSFKNIQSYSTAVTANALFYPRLQLGATIKQMRALFLGVIIIIKKRNQGQCTVDDMKQTFLDYYNATQADPSLVAKFIEIMQELDEGGDPQKFKEDIEKFFQPLPAAIVKGYAGIMLSFSASLTINQGKAAYQAYQTAKAVGGEYFEMSELDAEGRTVQQGAQGAEVEVMGVAEIAVRSMGVLAGVASIVFASLEIAQAVDTDKKLTKAISDSKDGITKYYTALVSKTIDGEDTLLGTYECHKYDNTASKNDWHYVTISKVDASTWKWTNRAGVSWTLRTTSDKSKLDVGQECPYYNFNDGNAHTQYTQATVVLEGDQVSGILGPWDELYAKSANS